MANPEPEKVHPRPTRMTAVARIDAPERIAASRPRPSCSDTMDGSRPIQALPRNRADS
jgi:hypothetical protein